MGLAQRFQLLKSPTICTPFASTAATLGSLNVTLHTFLLFKVFFLYPRPHYSCFLWWQFLLSLHSCLAFDCFGSTLIFGNFGIVSLLSLNGYKGNRMSLIIRNYGEKGHKCQGKRHLNVCRFELGGCLRVCEKCGSRASGSSSLSRGRIVQLKIKGTNNFKKLSASYIRSDVREC
jgi:hypothetical protein